MKEIPLTQGKVALVDDEDYEYLMQWRWHADKQGKTYYAVRGRKEHGVPVKMHRVIAGAREGDLVDHKNRNGLDNRRCNLRVCGQSENQMNRDMTQGSKTGYKGVHIFRDKYRARIRVHGRETHLGLFENPIDAAHAYDKAAKLYYGDFAVLNFPT